MKLNDDLKQMTPYELRKLQIDFMRFVATLGAPFLAIILGYAAKHWLGW